MCCCAMLNLASISISFGVGFVSAFVLAYGMFSFMDWDGRPELRNITNISLHKAEEDFHRHETVLNIDTNRHVRILCLVFIKSENIKKASHIKFTWGKRCNQLLFFGYQNEPTLPTVSLNVAGSLDHWSSAQGALEYVSRNVRLSQIDWIFKTDDETYTVVENLRYLLKNFNSSGPLFVDDIIRLESNKTVKLVKLGYVLSKPALKNILDNKSKCQPVENELEDDYLNRCLDKLGLKEETSKDCLGRLRFLPVELRDLVVPYSTYKWYGLYNVEMKSSLFSCCSDLAILFHQVSEYEMYLLEYLIYHLTPYGIVPNLSADLNCCGKPQHKQL